MADAQPEVGELGNITTSISLVTLQFIVILTLLAPIAIGLVVLLNLSTVDPVPSWFFEAIDDYIPPASTFGGTLLSTAWTTVPILLVRTCYKLETGQRPKLNWAGIAILAMALIGFLSSGAAYIRLVSDAAYFQQEIGISANEFEASSYETLLYYVESGWRYCLIYASFLLGLWSIFSFSPSEPE